MENQLGGKVLENLPERGGGGGGGGGQGGERTPPKAGFKSIVGFRAQSLVLWFATLL